MDNKMSLLQRGCRLTRPAQRPLSQCRRVFRQHSQHVGAHGAGATTTMVPHWGCPWAGHPLQQPIPLPRAPVGWLSQGDRHGARWGPSATTGGLLQHVLFRSRAVHERPGSIRDGCSCVTQQAAQHWLPGSPFSAGACNWATPSRIHS